MVGAKFECRNIIFFLSFFKHKKKNSWEAPRQKQADPNPKRVEFCISFDEMAKEDVCFWMQEDADKM